MSKQITMILTNGFEPDVRVYKEALYLVSRGFKITILCWDRESDFPEYEIKDGIEVVRFKIPSVYGSGFKQIGAALRYLYACRKYLKQYPCDYLHCNDLDGAIIGWLARAVNMPIVFDMHEFYEGYYSDNSALWRRITKFFIKKSLAALYENDAYIGNNYKEIHGKLHELKNYPDSAMISANPKTESPVFRVGYHGVVRGQIQEFTALFDAVNGMPDVRIDINGGGIDLKQLKELGKKYSNVFVHGRYDGAKESTKLYEATDLLFCAYPPDDPNQQETAEPVKYFEAILTGTPMLATESLSIGKKVKANGLGLVCDTRNPEEIRKAILKIKEDKDLWKRCHENELAQAYKYDWQEEVKILDKIYK